MIKKRKLLLGTLLTTMFISIPSVNAFSFNAGFADTGSGDITPPREDIEYELGSVPAGNGKIVYTCIYNYDIKVNNNITINGYSIDDEPLMETNLIIDEEDRVLAGTSIGLNIYERKTISWEITKAEVNAIKYEKKKKNYYLCDYSNLIEVKPLPGILFSSITLLSKIQSIAVACNSFDYYTTSRTCQFKIGCAYTNSYSYSVDDGYVEEPVTYIPKSQKDACQEKAANEAKNEAAKYRGTSYQVELSDSNDINGKNTEKIVGKQVGVLGELSSGTTNGKATYTYVYKKNRACINVRTSKITYKEDKCGTDEIEIKNTTIDGLEHWHYFIPLNTKSNQNAEINLLPSDGGTLIKKQCLYVMKNNPVKEGATSYVDLIIKTDGTNFKGDYYKGESISTDIKEINKNGCKLTSKIKINAKQRFYNEVEDENGNITFKGFNFYYKPIDINEPFPNGINNTSIWYNWSNNDKKTPDLTKSYEEATYVAQIKNASEVRKYTKNNSYTSWDNMYTNGISEFIEKEGIVTRNEKVRNSFYKLGCGPSNKDWEECKQ